MPLVKCFRIESFCSSFSMQLIRRKKSTNLMTMPKVASPTVKLVETVRNKKFLKENVRSG